jgi:putative endonuclease
MAVCHCEKRSDEAIPSLERGVHPADHRYFVYILTNRHHTTLYIGVTNDLVRRVHEHRIKIASAFTTRYNVDQLVFFEETSVVRTAIAREKQLKAGSRERKIALINAMNPDWRDLFDDFL